jgi:hypothetical protein
MITNLVDEKGDDAMNLDMQIKNKTLFSEAYYEVEDLYCKNKNSEAGAFTLGHLSLEDILKEFGPLPEEALLFGLADDGLPVLLDLRDPTPGPILIAGDTNVGKTDFLKALAYYTIVARQPCEIQYGVITNRSYEWNNYFDYPHTVGIFSMSEEGAIDLLHALSIWIEMKKSNQQTVLLLIDGLDEFLFQNSALEQDLQKILLSGPGKNVWPIATINLERSKNVTPWLKYFYTRIFGYTNHKHEINYDGIQDAEFETLSKEIEFSLRENSQWMRFRIPRT